MLDNPRESVYMNKNCTISVRSHVRWGKQLTICFYKVKFTILLQSVSDKIPIQVGCLTSYKQPLSVKEVCSSNCPVVSGPSDLSNLEHDTITVMAVDGLR